MQTFGQVKKKIPLPKYNIYGTIFSCALGDRPVRVSEDTSNNIITCMLLSNICLRITAVVQTMHVRQCVWNRPRLNSEHYRVSRTKNTNQSPNPNQVTVAMIMLCISIYQARVLEEMRFLIDVTK